MNKYLRRTESGILKRTNGQVKGVLINSHTSGTLKLIDGTEGGVAASSVLTSAGAMAPADYAISTLTSNGTNVADGATVVCGATGGTLRTYRFKDIPLAAYDVQIGDDAAESLANLYAAINASGTEGVEYFVGTLVNPDIIAYGLSATTLDVAFRTIGIVGNDYTTTETSATLEWTAGTLAGGVDTDLAMATIDTTTYIFVLTLAEALGLPAVPYQVKWLTSEAVTLDHFKMAINASGIAGTHYSTGTFEHPSVYATTNTNTEQTIVSKHVGAASNSIVTTETLGNYSWTGATLAGGTGATGRVIFDSALSVIATTGEHDIDFHELTFDNALYAVFGGVADLTFVFK